MAAEHWAVTGPQTIELDDVTALSVHIIDGRADVVAHDEPVTRVEVHSVDGRPVEVRLDDDGRLVVGHETLSGWKAFFDRFRDFSGRARADVYVAVPRDTPVKVGTVRGETLLAGMRGDARADTVSGSVLVADTEGSLDVDTVSGEVTVRDHRGDVATDSVSGAVTVTGWVPAVDTSTVSGAVTLDLYDQPRRVRCTSVSGAVLVRLPDASAVDAKLSGVSGRLVVGGLEAAGFGTRVLRAAHPVVTTIEASTVSGDVTVLGRQADGGA